LNVPAAVVLLISIILLLDSVAHPSTGPAQTASKVPLATIAFVTHCSICERHVTYAGPYEAELKNESNAALIWAAVALVGLAVELERRGVEKVTRSEKKEEGR
jgi:hypothetical protein